MAAAGAVVCAGAVSTSFAKTRSQAPGLRIRLGELMGGNRVPCEGHPVVEQHLVVLAGVHERGARHRLGELREIRRQRHQQVIAESRHRALHVQRGQPQQSPRILLRAVPLDVEHAHPVHRGDQREGVVRRVGEECAQLGQRHQVVRVALERPLEAAVLAQLAPLQRPHVQRHLVDVGDRPARRIGELHDGRRLVEVSVLNRKCHRMLLTARGWKRRRGLRISTPQTPSKTRSSTRTADVAAAPRRGS